MLVVTVYCGGCNKTRAVRFVAGYPIDEYECCGRGDVEEVSSKLV